MTVVDLQPLIQAVIALAASAISTIGLAALIKLIKKLNLQISAAQIAAYDDALNKSLVYGATKATQAITERGWDHPKVASDVIATAMQQMVNNFPDALAGVGRSTDLHDADNNQKINAALERALPGAMAEVAASPATPPDITVVVPVSPIPPIPNPKMIMTPFAPKGIST